MLSKHIDRYKSGVYKITNLVNGKIYVGSSVNVYNRRYTHHNKLKNRTHTSKHLTNAYHKYGADNFLFEILEYCSNITEREQYYIDFLKPAYNKRLVAQNNSGLSISKGQRELISATLKRRYKEGMTTYKQQHRWRPVEQYSLRGEFIQEYPNCREAERALGVIKDTVVQGCSERSFFRTGYQWKYKDSNKSILSLNLEGYKGGNIIKIIRVTNLCTGKIEFFPGPKAAAFSLGYNQKTVFKALKEGSIQKGTHVFEYYTAPIKSGELLETPEADNQQPS